MPFINGRYYANPVMGEALEAAREAEAALAALENGAHEDAGTNHEAADDSGAKTKPKGPIHRVEIEAAEVVPAHSGRAARGFVARVHRQPANGIAGRHGSHGSRGVGAEQSETHVFSDHRDLVSFLRNELGTDPRSEHAS
jgi:hypothetical protein